MKVRFQADADFNVDIIRAVLRREPAIDFRTAEVAGVRGLSDAEVLAVAAATGRMLVTHDRRTMPRRFGEFIVSNTSPGLLVVSQRREILLVVEDLLLIWTATEAEEWRNRIFTIPL